uniref:Uncharacterized protein n=1 Tax=Ursus maritimus TaxID=29073 RepID=A0A452V674_URSMA
MQVPGSSLSSFRAHSVADLPRLPLAEDVEFTGKTEALVLELLQPPAFLASRTGAGLPSSPPGSAPVLFGTFHAFPSVFPPEVSRALRRAGRCLAKPRAEPADAQATCLCLDRRLELVILPNEPHQLLQLLVLPHQPLDLMPKALIIDAGERRCSWDP